jgi:bacteriocin biosynthesis cyclodehydratase domain-containing protein
VGPLVIPGVTSCLRCADLHRRDRDPAWDVLAVQLAVPPHRGLPSDVGVATVVAGIAALQALAYLDGEPVATRCGTLELHLPDWRLRRRSWPPHPACGCGA